jgi:hypothetical protein
LTHPFGQGRKDWVDIHSPWHSLDGSTAEYEQVGYDKIHGKWDLAIKTGTERRDMGECISEEAWLFGEAPRNLRISAIERIPQLLEGLAQKASDMTQDIQQKIGEVQVLVATIKTA